MIEPNATSPPGSRSSRGGDEQNCRRHDEPRLTDSPAQEFSHTVPRQGDKLRARLVLPFLNPPLPVSSIRVGLCLIDRCNRYTGQCDPAGRRLQHDARLSARATWKGIKRLEAAGVIRRFKEGRFDHVTGTDNWARNSYEVNWQYLNEQHDKWKSYQRAYRRRG
jgi:hypothetical protein